MIIISTDNHIKLTCGIVLLAAGASSRLGKPKQLLPYKGTTLLKHAVQLAVDAALKPIVIVVGANANILNIEIEESQANIVMNETWQEGMASSIRTGLQKMLELEPTINSVIMMVCDQPYVTVQLLQNLIVQHNKTGKPIIASSYKNNLGTPALFDATIFSELMQLKGDIGAKKILNNHPEWVAAIDFPMGEIDIDTEEDYKKLLQHN